jgi:hypothetical protein
MTSNNIVLYPRGFIGFDTGLITDKTSGVNMDDWVKSIKLNKPIMQEVSPYKGIPQVDSIWKEYETGVNFITAFDFRERILKLAFVAFGTLSFYDWCNLQNKNIYFTALHKKFLNDTFNFICSGKRSVANTTWQSLLSMKEANSKDSETIFELNEFFRINGPDTYRRSFRLSDAVNQWVMQENGFEDLLMTIHLLFGTD